MSNKTFYFHQDGTYATVQADSFEDLQVALLGPLDYMPTDFLFWDDMGKLRAFDEADMRAVVSVRDARTVHLFDPDVHAKLEAQKEPYARLRSLTGYMAYMHPHLMSSCGLTGDQRFVVVSNEELSALLNEPQFERNRRGTMYHNMLTLAAGNLGPERDTRFLSGYKFDLPEEVRRLKRQREEQAQAKEQIARERAEAAKAERDKRPRRAAATAANEANMRLADGADGGADGGGTAADGGADGARTARTAATPTA